MALERTLQQVVRWRQGLAARLRPHAPGEAPAQADFLPDFCNGRVIASVFAVAELLAVVFSLITRRVFSNVYVDFAAISAFVQWIALGSVAVLCATRPHLMRLPPARAVVIAYLLLLCVTFLASEAAVWVLYAIGNIGSPRPEWYGYFQVQNLTVSAIINALALRYLIAMHELKLRGASEAQAKMQALQSRLRPHFLFNSMNIIASLIRSAPVKAEEAIEDVADLFRMMLGENESLVPIKNEIAVAQKYLSLEQLRLDNRLRVEWDVGSYPRSAVMPVLMLQPILEYAIYRGVEPSTSSVTVKARLWEAGDMIHIEVSYPVSTGTIGRRGRKEGNRETVLDNIRQRLDNQYGPAARLEEATDSEHRITLVLPTRGGKT